jgi:hypothetical protein
MLCAHGAPEHSIAGAVTEHGGSKVSRGLTCWYWRRRISASDFLLAASASEMVSCSTCPSRLAWLRCRRAVLPASASSRPDSRPRACARTQDQHAMRDAPAITLYHALNGKIPGGQKGIRARAAAGLSLQRPVKQYLLNIHLLVRHGSRQRCTGSTCCALSNYHRKERKKCVRKEALHWGQRPHLHGSAELSCPGHQLRVEALARLL